MAEQGVRGNRIESNPSKEKSFDFLFDYQCGEVIMVKMIMPRKTAPFDDESSSNDEIQIDHVTRCDYCSDFGLSSFLALPGTSGLQVCC